MIPRQWSPSKKPEPSAPMPPWMLRPSALQLSRRARPPVPTPSGKPKPFALQPSGMLRPGDSPRLTHSTGNMPKPSNTWRKKSSKRKVRVRLTYSLPFKLPYKASPAELRGAMVASYHILMGQAPISHPFTLSQGASPIEQLSAPAVLLVQCLSVPPGPRGNTPPLTQWMTCLLAGPHPRQPQKGPPAPSGKRFPLGTRYSNGATQKHSVRTPV